MKTKNQLTNRILSLVLVFVLVLGMVPTVAFAAEPVEAQEYPNIPNNSTPFPYGSYFYFTANNCLYSIYMYNLKANSGITHIKLYTMSGGMVFIAQQNGEWDDGKYRSINENNDTMKPYPLSNLPKSAGESVKLHYNSNYEEDKWGPSFTVTCLAVGSPEWTWNGTTATARFLSEDGNAAVTRTVNGQLTSTTPAENCLQNVVRNYSATVTLNGKSYVGYKQVSGEAGPHSYTKETVADNYLKSAATCTAAAVYYKSCEYCGTSSNSDDATFTYGSAPGHTLRYEVKENTTNVLEETCQNNCGHIATATLTPDKSEYIFDPEYTVGGATLTFSDNWAGSKLYQLSFNDNYDVGTATVAATVYATPGNVLTCQYQILPADISQSFALCIPDVYNGNALNAAVYYRAKAEGIGGHKLTEGQDYTAQWDQTDLTQAGEYNLTVTGINNYTGSFTQKITVNPANLKNVSVVNNKADFDYTGEAQKLEVTASGETVDGSQVTFTYRVGESGEYVSEPAVTDGGTHTVYWKASAPNHNDVTGSFTVTVNPVNGDSSVSIADWVYGNTASTPVPVSSTNGIDNVTYQYKVKGADDSTYTATVPTQAGDYTVKATFPATTNYKMAEATADFTVSKRPITVTANDASKTYGGTDPELEWTVTSGTVLASDPLSVNISRVAGENAGDYTITVGQDEGANPNYDITFVNGTLTIHKASLTVIVKNQEIVYGDEIGEIIAGFDGFIDTTHYTTQLDFSNEVRTSTYKQYDDVGTYPITVSGITSNNYEITYVPGTLTVNPKPITVTIADKTGVYGEEVAELTAATDGIVNNDTNVYSLATTATSTANAGTYPITGTTLDNNYAITFVNGTYTITKAPVNSTGTDMTVSYAAGMEVDLRQMFTIDENAGEADYWITHLTGDGSFTSAPYLYRIDKAGTFTVKIITEETANYNSGTATAVLTVNPGDPGIGIVTAAVVNDTLDTSAIVLTRENTDIDGNLTVDAGQALAWGDNTIRYTFTPTDGTNYKTVTGTVTVIVVDTVAPVGTVSIDENKWNDLWNTITFGLFFKETKTVKVEIATDLSGIAKVEYYDSAVALTADAVKAITAWNDMGADYAQDVTAEDAKTFIYYIRITDKAGNVTYISTADATYDLTKPAISGITNGSTYYTTQKVTVTDKNIDTITLNGEAATDAITLEGNKEATYTIVATDKAGNSTTVTVTMKPIKELAKATENLGNDNVTSADAPALEELVAKLDELIADPDTSDDGERETLEQHKVIAEALLKTIEDVAKATDTENTAKVEDVTADNVTPEDKSNLEDAKADLEDALENNGGNYTEEEKKAIKDEIQRIEDALETLENVEAAEDAISDLPATVEPDDEETVAKIEEAKKIYGGLTDYEKSLVDEKVKEKLDKLTAAAVAYVIVKGDGGKWSKGTASGLSFTANGPISKFVSVEIDGKVIDAKYYSVKAGSTIITLNASYLETLSVGTHTITVVYSDGETEGTFKINPKSATPATGDNFNVLLWTSVMIVSLAAIAVLLIEQKKRRYVK